MKKAPIIVLAGCAVFILTFFLGPSVTFDPVDPPQVTPLNKSLEDLDLYVHLKAEEAPNLKPNNESRILWADSIRKTPYSLVYLHGFSASPMESGVLPIEIAKRYGMNLYMPLLAGHGQDDKDSFADLTPNDLVKDAKEALAIGKLLGEKVILISCSTGGTLSIYLASGNRDMIDALIMYSPNIQLFDKMAKLATGPWGEKLVLNVAGKYREPDPDEEMPDDALRYWTTTYRNEGIIALQSLLDQTMTEETFRMVDQPYFIGYYYKNAEEQDKTISVDAIKKFDLASSTPKEKRMVVAFPDAGAHVIANPLKANNVDSVRDETYSFIERVLQIDPKD